MSRFNRFSRLPHASQSPRAQIVFLPPHFLYQALFRKKQISTLKGILPVTWGEDEMVLYDHFSIANIHGFWALLAWNSSTVNWVPWLAGWLAEWPVGWLAGWLAGWLVGWWAGSWVGGLVGWWVGGCLVHWVPWSMWMCRGWFCTNYNEPTGNMQSPVMKLDHHDKVVQ